MVKAIFSVLAAQLVLLCSKIEEARGASAEEAATAYNVGCVILSQHMREDGEFSYSVRVDDVMSDSYDTYSVAFGRGASPEEAFAEAMADAGTRLATERARARDRASEPATDAAATEIPPAGAAPRGWSEVGTDCPN